jgi:hypothetical protein
VKLSSEVSEPTLSNDPSKSTVDTALLAPVGLLVSMPDLLTAAP